MRSSQVVSAALAARRSGLAATAAEMVSVASRAGAVVGEGEVDLASLSAGPELVAFGVVVSEVAVTPG